MTLRCTCGSYDLEITSQSYSDSGALERYECQHCGATGFLSHRNGETRLSGCLESDMGVDA